MTLLPQIQVEGGAEWLARTATQCLIDEARLSPKPGLVDSRGNGAHHDLSLALMERSAHSLTSTFQALAQTVANTAAQLAQLPDDAAPKVFSKGLRATHRYRVPGAREEAQQAFPHIMQRALPQLRLSRLNGSSETNARLDALMAIMTSLTDTCVMSRAGMEGLDAMQNGARAVLNAGGCATLAGQQALARLDRQMLTLNASPGGAADLLAATLFLDRVETPYSKH